MYSRRPDLTFLVYICFCCTLLAWAYKQSRYETVLAELAAEKAAHEKTKADMPIEWADTKVMLHLLASENYRLNGQAKRWLPKGMVIPQEEVDALTKNGWFYPNNTANGAKPK